MRMNVVEAPAIVSAALEAHTLTNIPVLREGARPRDFAPSADTQPTDIMAVLGELSGPGLKTDELDNYWTQDRHGRWKRRRTQDVGSYTELDSELDDVLHEAIERSRTLEDRQALLRKRMIGVVAAQNRLDEKFGPWRILRMAGPLFRLSLTKRRLGILEGLEHARDPELADIDELILSRQARLNKAPRPRRDTVPNHVGALAGDYIVV